MGLYEFNDFVLTGGPCAFLRIMDGVLCGIEKYDNLIDVILVLSADKELHITALRTLF